MMRPRLANTLEKIAAQGGDAFYNGSLADDIANDVQDCGMNNKELTKNLLLWDRELNV